jgi:hypothetical protein
MLSKYHGIVFNLIHSKIQIWIQIKLKTQAESQDIIFCCLGFQSVIQFINYNHQNQSDYLTFVFLLIG